MAVAPAPVKRILTVSLETGRRPGDVVSLSRQHLEAAPNGRRIKIVTSKRRRLASIPVSDDLGRVLDETPADRSHFLVNASGKRLTVRRASECMRYWIDRAGLRRELQWKDTRGTAATKLLNFGLSLGEIAL
jgi:integrase